MKEEAQELSIAVVGYRVDGCFISAYGGKFFPVEPYLEDFSLIRKYQRYQTTNEGSTLLLTIGSGTSAAFIGSRGCHSGSVLFCLRRGYVITP